MTVLGNVFVAVFFVLMLALLAAAVKDAWSAFVDSAEDGVDLVEVDADEGAAWDRARDRWIGTQNGVA